MTFIVMKQYPRRRPVPYYIKDSWEAFALALILMIQKRPLYIIDTIKCIRMKRSVSGEIETSYNYYHYE